MSVWGCGGRNRGRLIRLQLCHAVEKVVDLCRHVDLGGGESSNAVFDLWRLNVNFPNGKLQQLLVVLPRLCLFLIAS